MTVICRTCAVKWESSSSIGNVCWNCDFMLGCADTNFRPEIGRYPFEVHPIVGRTAPLPAVEGFAAAAERARAIYAAHASYRTT